ncbi:MAG: hypothetical protein JWM76_3494 [Pseudonocardiales bacterium]|nr:hypothetical protein [Pseudonocardiales bacterium]
MGGAVPEQRAQVRLHEGPAEEVRLTAVGTVDDHAIDSTGAEGGVELEQLGEVSGDVGPFGFGQWRGRLEVIKKDREVAGVAQKRIQRTGNCRLERVTVRGHRNRPRTVGPASAWKGKAKEKETVPLTRPR